VLYGMCCYGRACIQPVEALVCVICQTLATHP